MYIKEIKINGFKSFADKVNLELNKNFTGIVGPNGSGKSNIVDALKWVMGEQSIKTLRGSSSMSDIIFNGSQTRESSRSASVSIVLDNTDKRLPYDYNEIEIKRMVYKTGENEYYINKDKVRLKDITDLFLDSFSSKESLSIIPQGKINEILNGKPTDKRSILEDAAGVLKYKKRKEDSLRKLEKTNDNISRVDMIINELSTQVEPLKEQANKAKIYKENREKLESIEVSLLASDIAIYNEEYNLVKAQIEDLSSKIINNSNIDSKDKVELENLKIKRIKLDEKISSSQKELLSLSDELTELNSKKNLLIERQKYDKESTVIKNNLIELKEKELKLKNDILTLEEERKIQEEKYNTLNKQLENIKLEHNKNSTLINTTNNEINDLNKRKLESINKKDILEYNIENLSKVPYSVKSVLNNPTLNGIIDRIGNIISFDNEYAACLDVALAGSVNNVITENDNYAKNAIEYLKRNKKGRVTFFPLNVIKPKSIDPQTMTQISNITGFINVAANLVNYDKKFYNIIMNQLGNIIVVNNTENALIISKTINSRYRIVTLDGDIIHVGGSLTGGSLNTNSVLSEKTELDTLNKNIIIINNQINNKTEYLSNINYEFDRIKEILYKNNLEIINIKEALDININTINNNKLLLDNIKNEIKDLNSNGEVVDKNIEEITNNYYKKINDKKVLELEIKSLETARKDLLEDIEEKEKIIKKNESNSNSYQTKLNDLNIKEAKLSINLDNLLNRLSSEYQITFEKARNDYELEIPIEEARSIINDLKRTLKSLGEVNLSSIEEYERINKRYTFLNTQREDLKQSENNLLEIINNMDDIMIDKFATTFKKVNIEFNKVFKSLFSGGEAHLELTDPTNMLETGIEIIATPPGKKQGLLSLLSGGEKSLTAISLLFAIMNLKDVPFVILDEVESALDEANVEKFGEYINSYKGKTQLLIITHKKKTMEYVDLLYGITMQESGVSKLVSVKLEEIK